MEILGPQDKYQKRVAEIKEVLIGNTVGIGEHALLMAKLGFEMTYKETDENEVTIFKVTIPEETEPVSLTDTLSRLEKQDPSETTLG